MADGGIRIPVELNISKADKDLERLKTKIAKAERELSEKKAGNSALQEEMEKANAAADEAIAKVRELKKELQNARGSEKDKIRARLADATEEANAARGRANSLTNRFFRTEEQIRNDEASLTRMKEEAGDLEQAIEKARPREALNKALDSATKKAKNLIKTLFGITTAVALFKKLKSYISGAIQEYAEYDKELKYNMALMTATKKAIQVTNGAALAQIYQALLPILQKIANWTLEAANAAAKFIAILSGKDSYKRAVVDEKEVAAGLEEISEEAKEAKRQLLGFDELNILNDDKGSGSSGEKDKTALDGIKMEDVPIESMGMTSKIVEMMKQHLAELELAASAALLAMGLLLTLSGANIPLGLGLLALGAVGLASALPENWDWITSSIDGALSAIGLLAYSALLGIGLVLLFSGANIPLGLGLVALGAAGLASLVAENWDGIPESVAHVIAMIDFIIGGALAAIGLVLLFATPAFSWLGLGLLIGGLSLMAHGVKIDWDYISDETSNAVASIMLILGGALFAIGAIFAFTGANVPLGIGLMLAGAATLGSAVALNWDYLGNMLNGKIGAIIAGIGAGVFVIGLILAFAGHIPLGIAMMIAGASALYTVASLNWDAVETALQGPLGKTVTLIGESLFAIGAVLAFAGFLPLGIGLMVAGAASVGTAAALNWEKVVTAMQGPLGKIVALVGVSLFAIGLFLALTGIGLPLGVGLMLAGAAAVGTAAVINWDTIQQKMRGSLGLIMTLAGGFLLVIGLILAFTGVGLPLGFALMAAGGASLGVGAANYDWDIILNKLKEAWTSIQQWWNNDIAKYFTWDYWQDKLNQAFGNLSFPQLRMPQIHIYWEPAQGWAADILSALGLPLSFPRFDWYAKGGVFDYPQLIGVGEAGKEAVVPLERNTEWMNLVADGLMERFERMNFANQLADAFATVPMPAMAGGTVAPPNALFSNFGGGTGDGFLEELRALRSEISALARQPVQVDSKIYLDRRKIGESVTEYQRDNERARGF